MKEILEYLARALADHPEQVEVRQVEGERFLILELKVASEDMGKIIGTIVKAAALRENKKVTVEIVQ
ncbi:MAG: KH domain-containing protein [Armatimonadetes bacterium]|nr:KH domain-containing protein [Armatimonadota bacterium]